MILKSLAAVLLVLLVACAGGPGHPAVRSVVPEESSTESDPHLPSATPMATHETEQVAADALAVLIESWNRSASGDPGGPALYGTGYWPDAELVDPSGNIWEGQPNIVQMHVDLWRTAFKGSELRGSVRKTRRLSPTLMIADYDLELRLFPEAPGGSTVTGDVVTTYLKHVVEKRGNEWKVVSAQNTFYSNAPDSR